jgi:hypothetical protein
MVGREKRVELGGCLHEIRRHANTVGTRTDTVIHSTQARAPQLPAKLDSWQMEDSV